MINPETDARDLLAAASAKFDVLADNADNPHERGFWARAQEQTARYGATLAYIRTLEDGIPATWEHVRYTRAEVDQAQAVITWHGELIKSYAMQAASEKITRMANETITMLRDKRTKVEKTDGTIAARNVIARLGKAELRTDAGMRDQVIDLLVLPPPFDTGGPEGALPDGGPSWLSVPATFATFATFRAQKRGKVAKVANYAPTDKVNCRSAPRALRSQ